MAPKRRQSPASAAAAQTKKPRRTTPQIAPAVAAAAGQDVHNPNGTARSALAALLGRDAGDLPSIRKTEDTPANYSIYDVIALIKGCSVQHASQEFDRLRERYGDGSPICGPVSFRDSRGRVNPNKTPVTTIEGIVEVVLLLTGTKAAKIRQKIARVFVQYLGGGFR